ncbi:Rup1p NDAI_0C01390 [Naumovozyma dairenensis CBS 421]|uniref:UBA domain-containing protein n=1 Tax=Naumovozyma dairenensis (strain ATCC 10597 / BCRC 20456 / CBS 421 / NBRC 0211 / NRRL Y-12639) TaxID=1071378 RepID=G0W7N9_NAUDC|nr:hypothetical protein NDAI_0C01390 [Naumovozyma dairenensis CBS 421]CCD23800.1 hypothetical protein NDAI_0C01390 [Naumovozyma dairenensis CBS 421]
MESNDSVSSLMEMGIPREVAVNALIRANGNLEAAVAFIFSNEIPPENNETSTVANDNDTGQQEPSQLPPRSEASGADPYQTHSPTPEHYYMKDERNAPSSQSYEQQEYIPTSNQENVTSQHGEDRDDDGDNIQENDESTFSSSSTSSQSPAPSPPNYNVVTYTQLKARVTDPTIILPVPMNSLLENYLALIMLAIAINIPTPFLRPDFKDLNYENDWYKGNSLSIPNYGLKIQNDHDADDEGVSEPSDTNILDGEGEKNNQRNDDIQPKLLWQLQKLISVVNSTLSERSYISTKVFSLGLTPDVRYTLANYENLADVLPVFYKSLATEMEKCVAIFGSDITENDKVDNADNDNNNGNSEERMRGEMESLFVSTASYEDAATGERLKTPVTTLSFSPEEYESNLYKMFNTLLFPEIDNPSKTAVSEGDVPGTGCLDYIAPIFTVVFHAMDSTTDEVDLPGGVDMPMEFYPQLYTSTCRDALVRDVFPRRKEAHRLSKELLQKFNQLRSFQGKDITMFLKSTMDYLTKDCGSETKALEEMKILETLINNAKNTIMEDYKALSADLQGPLNVSHPEVSIIDQAKASNLIDDEPYLLTMAVISPLAYFIRNRQGKWYLVRFNMISTEFQITECESIRNVQTAIKQCTIHANEEPLMFIYCRKSAILDDLIIQKYLEDNKGCLQFSKDDQIALDVLRQQIFSSDDIQDVQEERK